MKNNCPICKSKDISYLYNTLVPTLQNRVYDNIEEAANCAKGNIYLTHCNNCNFSFNADFDINALVYDEHYDNAVPSKLFIEYYRSICKYLFDKYDLESGIVYDVGCGKGTFLNILCSLYPSVKGIGIDPSYEGNLNPLENLVFIQDFFKAEQVISPPSLILSRHVFEHIEFPKDFLQIIWEPIKDYRNIPVFIEVPDFGWIVKNRTFWDLCYEHCNYFSEKSIENMFDNDFSELMSITKSFSDQYLWVEGVFNGVKTTVETLAVTELALPDIQAFVNSIHAARERITTVINLAKSQDKKIVVWGMATKGVIFSNLIDQGAELIDFCIDVNKTKQNKYAPITAHKIQPPGILAHEKNNDLLVIVMNAIYLKEIKAEAGLQADNCEFIDAHGNNL